jgi:1-acyl-sn-glycerol-3-phosphate acyltransferase
MPMGNSKQIGESIKYPRNLFVRKSFQVIGKLLIKILTTTEIDGLENYPKSGRLIVVGNHTGVLETVLMTSFAPRPIEYMGSNDIPHEPQLAFFMNSYKYIPVFRGNVSKGSMKAGLEVLNQDGVIGIFPEGGIWEPAIRKAQPGVAWLSHHGNSPVLPVGFSITAGLMMDALALKRPILKMNIGKLIPSVQIQPGKPKKLQYQESAQAIMDAVWALLPKNDLENHQEYINEKFRLEIKIHNVDGNNVHLPDSLTIRDGGSFAKFLYRSTLINNFRDNLKLYINPLKTLDKNPKPQEIFKATSEILNYLKNDNPYYFTYRYGQKEGKKMGDGIRQVHDIARWAVINNFQLTLIPIRTYTSAQSNEEIIEYSPTELRKW